MTNRFDSWAAIQARIAESQRQYRGSDFGATYFVFGTRTENTRWFQLA